MTYYNTKYVHYPELKERVTRVKSMTTSKSWLQYIPKATLGLRRWDGPLRTDNVSPNLLKAAATEALKPLYLNDGIEIHHNWYIRSDVRNI